MLNSAEHKRALGRAAMQRYRIRHAERLRAEVEANPYAAVRDKEALFWSKVDVRGSDECWEWKASRTGDGYGRFHVSVKAYPANRVALMLSLGRNLSAEECALHHCDNPACCNPAHLYAGTHTQNMADKFARGRHVPHGGFKIDAAVAMAIRAATGKQADIAAAYGVSRSYVSMVKSGKRWARLSK